MLSIFSCLLPLLRPNTPQGTCSTKSTPVTTSSSIHTHMYKIKNNTEWRLFQGFCKMNQEHTHGNLDIAFFDLVKCTLMIHTTVLQDLSTTTKNALKEAWKFSCLALWNTRNNAKLLFDMYKGFRVLQSLYIVNLVHIQGTREFIRKINNPRNINSKRRRGTFWASEPTLWNCMKECNWDLVVLERKIR